MNKHITCKFKMNLTVAGCAISVNLMSKYHSGDLVIGKRGCSTSAPSAPVNRHHLPHTTAAA